MRRAASRFAPDLYGGRFKALVTKERQASTACYVSYYPHWQHPEAPEPLQVYQYAPEVDELRVPVPVFLGEHEQYQRVRSILTGIETLRRQKRDARVIVYPAVGREFDFRSPQVRTLADDLATGLAVARCRIHAQAPRVPIV